MIYKSEIPALFNTVQAYLADGNVVASEGTALVLHGLMDNVERAHFDVSSSLFEAARAKHNCFVANVDGKRMIQIGHELALHEGPYMDRVFVDGIPTYALESMRVRYEVRGRSTQMGALQARCLAADISRLQEKLANPAPVVQPYVKPGPVKNWGELSAEEIVFEKQCDRADWYYSYSDDINVYRAGKASCGALKATADEKGGNYALLYKYYSSK